MDKSAACSDLFVAAKPELPNKFLTSVRVLPAFSGMVHFAHEIR
jgi:hypothetical protein